MECNVFSVAGRVCHHTLLLGHPRNRPRPQAEAITADGVARLSAVGIVRVGKANKTDRVGATQGKAKSAGAFKVADNVDGGGPMLGSVAVHEGGQATNGKRDVWSRAYGHIVEGAD